MRSRNLSPVPTALASQTRGASLSWTCPKDDPPGSESDRSPRARLSSLSISTSSSPCQDADPQRFSSRLSRVDITIPTQQIILYNYYLIYNLYYVMPRKSSGLEGGQRRSIPSRRCRPATGFCSASTPATKSESRTTSIERLTAPMEEHDEHHASLVSNPEIPFPP